MQGGGRYNGISHEAGGSEGADDGAGDELGPGFPYAPAGEDAGEPGVLGGHILDVGFWIFNFGFLILDF